MCFCFEFILIYQLRISNATLSITWEQNNEANYSFAKAMAIVFELQSTWEASRSSFQIIEAELKFDAPIIVAISTKKERTARIPNPIIQLRFIILLLYKTFRIIQLKERNVHNQTLFNRIEWIAFYLDDMFLLCIVTMLSNYAHIFEIAAS